MTQPVARKEGRRQDFARMREKLSELNKREVVKRLALRNRPRPAEGALDRLEYILERFRDSQ